MRILSKIFTHLKYRLFQIFEKIKNIYRKNVIKSNIKKYIKKDYFIPIENLGAENNNVSDYWTGHTVKEKDFISAKESMNYRNGIWVRYPYYREFADMDRMHDNEVILDYGCGPGNDLTWYSQVTNPKRIIGVDVSITSLYASQYRMALHNVTKEKCRLILLDDSKPIIPLEDESIDFISCQGVLMHTSYPNEILKEFYRILKKSNKTNCCIMCYNRDSIWRHLYVAYYLRFIDSNNLEKTMDEVKEIPFEDLCRMSTDGVNCPIARFWSPDEFIEMGSSAGFKVEYIGGYTNTFEIKMCNEYFEKALADERLEEEHKEFLRKVFFDENNYPYIKWNGRNVMCSIGGVYRLTKEK